MQAQAYNIGRCIPNRHGEENETKQINIAEKATIWHKTAHGKHAMRAPQTRIYL